MKKWKFEFRDDEGNIQTVEEDGPELDTEPPTDKMMNEMKKFIEESLGSMGIDTITFAPEEE